MVKYSSICTLFILPQFHFIRGPVCMCVRVCHIRYCVKMAAQTDLVFGIRFCSTYRIHFTKRVFPK